MSCFLRNAVFGIAVMCASVALIGAAEAAGAMAVGACGAYGYGFDYSKVADARIAAADKAHRKPNRIRRGDVNERCAMAPARDGGQRRL